MKDREEFLASVYAKRDAALKEQKKKKKSAAAALSTAAACLVLMVGITQTDMLDFIAASRSEGAMDSAAMESINEGSDTEALPEDAVQKQAVTTDDFAVDMDGVTGDTAAPGQAYYMLPCVTIEDRSIEGEATAMHAAGIEVTEKVQAWVDQLIENGQVVMIADDMQAETERLDAEEITCIVTIEREPQQKEVYCLTGEVGWYE